MGVLLEQREVDGVRFVDRLNRVAESHRFGIGDPIGHDLGVTRGSISADGESYACQIQGQFETLYAADGVK
jgi:hypothetical protein